MNTIGNKTFKSIWFLDFEFGSKGSELPDVRCVVANNIVSGETIRMWVDDIKKHPIPPYSIGRDDLVVAYYASAEVLCHYSLGWKAPENLLDLFTEFRVLTNGREIPCGNGILGAQAFFGIEGIEYKEKESMRDLALRGGTYTDEEKTQLLDYCESDVLALARLLKVMAPFIDIERALLRGRYMSTVAYMEFNGVSLDAETLDSLKANWEQLKVELVKEIDPDFNVYDGLTFKTEKFIEYLNRNKLSWPYHESGAIDLRDETFREMAKVYPQLQPLRELRATLSQLRLNELTVDEHGRSRCLISPFRSKTGRNQPSNNKFIFGMPSYLRHLIKPQPNHSLAYLDYSQQEFGIAAALSGDQNMMNAYKSGDPYLEFAKLAGAVPQDATKKSHPAIRDQYKACVLAVQYGMGPDSLAVRIQQPQVMARILLGKHKFVFREFWKYSDSVVHFAVLEGYLTTAMGWRIAIDEGTNERSIRNFPMQANGAEILRLACIVAAERGVKICAPVHDAILIEAPTSRIDEDVRIAQQSMGDASEAILGTLRLRTDAKIIRYPDRYEDERGTKMWETTSLLLKRMATHPVPKALGVMCCLSSLPVLRDHIRTIYYLVSLGVL